MNAIIKFLFCTTVITSLTMNIVPKYHALIWDKIIHKNMSQIYILFHAFVWISNSLKQKKMFKLTNVISRIYSNYFLENVSFAVC